MTQWYERRFRRHLLDMHIDDWSDEFLSRFSSEDYAENLALAHINMPMLYLQSHTGLCNFPTKTGRMHRAFEKDPDAMRRLTALCHEKGMGVVGYYSLIYNTWAHDTHPDWRMVDENGHSQRDQGSRYGLCCPNNVDYRAFVFTQIREMLDYFDGDGMFYDMPFWPQVCYCPACRARWAHEVGGEIPSARTGAEWEKLLERRRVWMGEFAQAVTDCTKALRPGISVEQNFACSIASGAEAAIGDEVNAACDYTGGDLTGGVYEQSFTCKYFGAASAHQPFEYMIVRCDPNLTKHTITKSRRELETAVMLTCAHHGASLAIDAIDPAGTMDRRFYRLLGEVFAKEELYEPYLTGDMLCDVGIVYHLPSKALRRGMTFSNHHAALGAARHMLERHILCGVAGHRQMESLSRYPALIAPMLRCLSDGERAVLVDYVTAGGRLYFSGGEDGALVEALLGTRVMGFTGETVTYLAPENGREALFADFNADYPLPFDCDAPILGRLPEDAQVLARIKLPYTIQNTPRYASIHSNPPGVMTGWPAVVRRRVGRGEVIWSAQPIEKERQAVYGETLCNLLALMGFESRLHTGAPCIVELTAFEDGDAVRVNIARLNSDFEGALPAFSVSLRCDDVKEVVRLPEGEKVSFERDGGETRFTARALDLFDMYELRR